MKRILAVFTTFFMLLLSGVSYSAVIDLHETTADLGGAFGNDFKLTMFDNWMNQNLMNFEIYSKLPADGLLPGGIYEWDGDSWEPVTPDEVTFADPLSYDDTLKEVSIDTTGLAGISHVASGNPADGACNWNTTDFILRCRTGATVYASVAMTLEATLDVEPPTITDILYDVDGLGFAFTASETGTPDCTKFTTTFATAGTIADYTNGTGDSCSSVTPVYSGDTGTLAGTTGAYVDTALNDSELFSGMAIDNTLNTTSSPSGFLVSEDFTLTTSSVPPEGWSQNVGGVVDWASTSDAGMYGQHVMVTGNATYGDELRTPAIPGYATIYEAVRINVGAGSGAFNIVNIMNNSTGTGQVSGIRVTGSEIKVTPSGGTGMTSAQVPAYVEGTPFFMQWRHITSDIGGTSLTVWTSSDGATWTQIITSGNGTSALDPVYSAFHVPAVAAVNYAIDSYRRSDAQIYY
jgi:hypothetical protein